MTTARVWVAALLLLAGACTTSSSDNPTIAATASPASSGASACAASAGLTGPVADHGTGQAAGAAVTVVAGDSYFEPTCLGGVRSGTTTVTVRNTGSALHNLSIPDLNIDQDVPAGQTITVDVKAAPPSVKFFCKYHRTSGMVGALLVSP